MRRITGWGVAGMLALAVAATGGSVASAADKPAKQSRLETVIVTRVDGEIVVDTEGKVREITVTSSTAPAIKALVEQKVREWRFKPVLIDGQPRNVRSAMRISLAATRRDADYLVRVDNAVFPETLEEKTPAKDHRGYEVEMPTARLRVLNMAPPVYPQGLMFMGVSGKVLLGLRIGLDGRVEKVEVIQSMLLDVRGRDRALEAAIRDFELAAVGKAKTWRFEVTAKAASPDPRDLTHTVPVVFLMDDKKDEPTGAWQTVVRTPKQPVSWLPRIDGVNSPGVGDVAMGETLPIASRLELEHNVIGATL